MAPVRCDALVVRTSGVTVVELPGLRQDDVVTEVEAYLDAVGGRQVETLRGAYVRDADVTVSANSVEGALDRCLGWMWHAFAAEALHHAVRRLRAKHLHRPSVWTPFAHTGP